MLSSFWAVTKNSFIEIVRQPVYAILLVAGMLLIGFSPAITMFSLMENERLMVDMGLATILLLGLVMSVLSSTFVITREIESQTVGAIVSKPVGRFVFVVAKFTAVALAMGLSTYLLTIVLLMAVRMGVPNDAHYRIDLPVLLAEVLPLLMAIGAGMYVNFFYRRNFTSAAVVSAGLFYTIAFALMLVVDADWGITWLPAVFAERHADQIAIAAVAAFLGIWVLSSVAVALSTRVNVVLNAIICVVVFFGGMIVQFVFSADFWPDAVSYAGLRIVPNLYVFWVADQLMMEVPYIPLDYLASAALYAVAFSAAMVCFAGFLFERREVI